VYHSHAHNCQEVRHSKDLWLQERLPDCLTARRLGRQSPRERAPPRENSCGLTEKRASGEGQLRSWAVNEVVETEREIQRARGAARVFQVVDFVFYVVYALLAI
jgi:hypothetical protein